MFNVLSILVGLLVAILAMVGFLPLLGWLNWLTIPLAIVGLVCGQLSANRTGRNLNAILILICAVRLSLGGGVI